MCSNGIVAENEECDDENLVDNDGCSSTCLVESGYSCKKSPSVCSAICGDGILKGNEECDDMNQ